MIMMLVVSPATKLNLNLLPCLISAPCCRAVSRRSSLWSSARHRPRRRRNSSAGVELTAPRWNLVLELVLPPKDNEPTMWGPQIAKLVNITTISLGFMVVITIVRWGYKPTYNVWGPHIVYIYIHTYTYIINEITVRWEWTYMKLWWGVYNLRRTSIWYFGNRIKTYGLGPCIVSKR